MRRQDSSPAILTPERFVLKHYLHRGTCIHAHPIELTTENKRNGGVTNVAAQFLSEQVLDAPQLQDDFYLNLVDWSSLNVLAVGLGACVYLWSACTSKVSVAYRLLSTVYCLLSTVYCLLSTVYCLLSTVCCLLCTVYCL